MIPIFSFINIILILRSVIILRDEFTSRTSKIVSFVLASLVMFFAYNSTSDYITQSVMGSVSSELKAVLVKFTVLIISYFILIYVFYTLLSFNKKRLLKISLLIAFLAGVMVNPLRVGTDVIFKSSLVSNIQSITEV